MSAVIRPERLRLAGLEIKALSVGGIETSYQIPAFDACLDIGRCPPSAIRMSTLLLTHGHIDHAAGLPYYISMRGMMRHSPPRIYCPAPAYEPIAKILSAWTELQADTDRCKLIAVEPGAVIPLKGDKVARAFSSPHRIDCIGYTLYSHVRKLKSELVGLSQEQIADRARAGENVQTVEERAEICFPGDTRIDVIEREPSTTIARVLILECTFVGPSVEVKKARRGGHVHLDEIAERASLFKNEVLLLTHFSRRHSTEEIEREVKAKFPEDLRSRVRLLLHER
jgi:ribonuclease Z